ncbi:MAG: PH domain-containing protein, partial [Fimbriimonadaceae bacterium]
FGFKSQDLIQKVFGEIDPAKATQQTWVAGGLFAFAVLILGWIVSMASTVIRWHGFKIVADQGKLIRTFGLLNEHRTTLVVRRVQTVELRSTLLRRIVGLWEVHVRTAGQKLGEERDGDGRQAVTGAFVPIVDREELPLCINMVLPGFDYVRLRIERTSRKMALRVAIASAWFWLAVSGGLVYGLGQKYLWTFAVAIVLSAVLGYWRARVSGYGRVRDVLAVRDGLSMLRTGLVPDSKLQSVTLRSDPIDRLLGLVNIGYTTAGLRGHISCLDREKGLALYEDLCSRMNASGDWHPDGV